MEVTLDDADSAATQRRRLLEASDVSVQWDTIDGPLAVSAGAEGVQLLNDGLTLVVAAWVLDPFASTTLQAIATIHTPLGVVVARSEITVPARGSNTPPRVGGLEVTQAPDDGGEVDLAAPNWVDDDEDLPLTYTFLYASGDRRGESMNWWLGYETDFAALPLSFDGDPILEVPQLPADAVGLNTIAVIVMGRLGGAELTTTLARGQTDAQVVDSSRSSEEVDEMIENIDGLAKVQ